MTDLETKMRLAVFPKCFMDELCVTRSMSVFDWIQLARELQPFGVTGLELYPGFLAEDSESYLTEVRAAIVDAGFVMPMLCASPDFTCHEKSERLGEVAKHRRMIELAAFFGARTCRVLSGQRRPGLSRDEGIRRVVGCLDQLLPCAEEHGVSLALENHFKDNYWDHPEFAQKMDLFCEILHRLESPWFGVNYDPSNTLLAGEDYLELLRRVKNRVVSMHASDRRPSPGVEVGPEGITDYSQLVHGEIGTGLIDYDAIFAELRSVGFDGWVSIEDGINGMEELKRSAAYLAPRMELA